MKARFPVVARAPQLPKCAEIVNLRRHRRWSWVTFDGLVTLILGLLLRAVWPLTALWLLGFAVGLAMLPRDRHPRPA